MGVYHIKSKGTSTYLCATSTTILWSPIPNHKSKNHREKWALKKIRESRRIRKWKEGFGEETETSRGWLSHRLFVPLGGVGFLPKGSDYAEAPNDDPYT